MDGERQEKPVIIVTGANGGVGFAVCQRLLLQLCHRVPQDSLPQRSITSRIDIDVDADVDYAGLSNAKAEAAKVELMQALDMEVLRIEKDESKNLEKDLQHAKKFRENVAIAVEKLDLASLKSVVSFSTEVRRKHPYVSHIVCNAGLANFAGYDWPLAIKQLCTHFVTAVTRPLFKLQSKGQKSEDGLGLIMQSNVLGHYFLSRLLEPHLKAYKSRSSSPARVLWMTSLEADPACYDPDDWQLLQTAKPYDASKYQMDLLAGHLEREQQLAIAAGSEVPVRHFIVHPGIVRTNIAVSSLNSIVLDYLMQAAFLLAHFLGSTAHVVTPYKAAVSAVHLILVALPFVAVASKNVASRPHILENGTSSANGNSDGSIPVPLKFGAEIDFQFREYVGVTEVLEWEKRRRHGAELAERFDRMCEDLIANGEGQ